MVKKETKTVGTVRLICLRNENSSMKHIVVFVLNLVIYILNAFGLFVCFTISQRHTKGIFKLQLYLFENYLQTQINQ